MQLSVVYGSFHWDAKNHPADPEYLLRDALKNEAFETCTDTILHAETILHPFDIIKPMCFF